MMTIRDYKRAESLEEAWQLNQKKRNRILGGMIWLKMETINVGTAIDLSGLGLDTIEETDAGFSIGRWSPCASWRPTPDWKPLPTEPSGKRCATSWACSCATWPPSAAASTAGLAFRMC